MQFRLRSSPVGFPPHNKVLSCRSHRRWSRHMRRREFLAGTAVAALAIARQAWAQTNRSTPRKRIAIISPARPVEQLKIHPYFRSFLEKLSRHGFVEGEHLIVDRYSGGGQTGSYADLARTVVAALPQPTDIVSANGTSERCRYCCKSLFAGTTEIF
jgi:hypothetical protein